MDQEWSVEWQAGVPRLSLSAEAFRGQKTEISFGKAHACRHPCLGPLDMPLRH